jgi:hypothetical protein
LEEKTKKLLEGIRAFSPLLQAYEDGYTKEEIKAYILETLKPEFENSKILNKYDIGLLTVESVNISKIRTYEFSSKIFDISLNIRRTLLAKNHDVCVKICSQWEKDIGKALSLYWNAVRFENCKKDLPLDEYAYELFRNIGSLIEGTLQIYLKELLHLTHYVKDEEISYSEISSLSLGNIVNLLSNKLDFPDLFTLKPWRVPLNQWRNIAQHYSIDTTGSLIVCRYGNKKQHEIQLERSELFEVAKSLFLLYSAIRTSHTIFFLDNANSLVSHCKGFKRKDSDEQFQFFVGAASQGFEVIDFDVSQDVATAHFIDTTDEDSLKRALHASQFVYELWIATKAKELVLKYDTKLKDKTLITTAKAKDCEIIYNGEKEFAYLAEVVKYQLDENT